jgi:putative ABC transport system permease protein
MVPLTKIAFRNLRRNRRRSLMTMSAIAVGAAAVLCFGEFIAYTILNFQTGVVRNGGHLSIYERGYSDFGAGNPSAYAIDDYQSLIELIRADPVLKPMTTVATPRIAVFGIGGNYDIDTSKPFMGVGVVPADFDAMRRWDGYGIYSRAAPLQGGLDPKDESVGVIGIGVARILGLCAPLHIPGCPSPPASNRTARLPGVASRDFSGLEQAAPSPSAPQHHGMPRLDLLVATAQGAPNVASFHVSKAEPQGIQELDDNYIRMNFDLAQHLLYGRGSLRATSVVLQLRQTGDIAEARDRLDALFRTHHLNLEVRDFRQLNQFYVQSTQFLAAIFAFMSVIMATIVLFTVVNTMSMAVLERTNEIGTARAIGLKRSATRRQFILEGSMLGGIGASLGLVAAEVIGLAVNAAKISIVIPGTSDANQLKLLTSTAVAPLLVGVWLCLVLTAILAALVPANQAARMPVVDALRHV